MYLFKTKVFLVKKLCSFCVSCVEEFYVRIYLIFCLNVIEMGGIGVDEKRRKGLVFLFLR